MIKTKTFINLSFSSNSMEQYESMLEDIYSKVKKPQGNGERFEIPKVEGHIEGKKTIITNFMQISDHLRRSKEQFLKFLLRELATPGQMEGDRLVLNRKVPSQKINEKIEQYVKVFVLCNECGKPDTEVIKDGRLSFLHCLACGAKHPAR